MPKKKSQSPPELEFHGFQAPNYTVVPDELFDVLLPHLSGSEIKVLLYLIRRTFGFKKQSDDISLNQICTGITTKENRVLDSGTGLSQSTVQVALKGLVEKNIIMAKRRTSREKGNEPTTYGLNVLSSFTGNRQRGGTISGEGVRRKSAEPLHRKSATQQTVDIQQTELQETDRQQQDDVVVALRNYGVADKVAKELASTVPPERIQEKINYYLWRVENMPQSFGPNPVGFLIDSIRQDYRTTGEINEALRQEGVEAKEIHRHRDYTKRKEDLPIESG